jgi:C4-dicarboxylate-specific signal transduction histidine kinase
MLGLQPQASDASHETFIRGYPLETAAGEMVGGVEATRDITERKRAERERERLQLQLQQAQKMEAIGTLAGGIAHDCNNILAAIMGYTEIAAEQLAKDDEVQESLKEVLNTGVGPKIW